MALSFVSRTSFLYPSGAQSLHANFHADGNGFYFGSDATIYAYNTSGRRIPANDISLTNHPNDTIWGLTKTTDNQWVTITRDAGTGYIGTIRLFSATGSANRVARIPDAITGINTVAHAWRAPKAVVEVGGHYYVRVVRDVAGNMRWLEFDGNLQVQDTDLVVSTYNPTALADAASNGYQYIFILQQSQRKIYAIVAHNALSDATFTTDLEATNTGPRAISAYEDKLYVADTSGYIYSYSGIPQTPTKDNKGFNVFALYSLSTFLRREYNPRPRRYP